MESDRLELLGRGKLTEQLLRAGLDTAIPTIRGDIDLFVYGSAKQGGFVVCPVRLRASASRSFSLDGRYEAVPNLIHVFVWGLSSDQVSIHALTHKEAALVAEELGCNLGPSWQKELYSGPHQNKTLVELMERYRMTPEKWVEKLAAVVSSADRSRQLELV